LPLENAFKRFLNIPSERKSFFWKLATIEAFSQNDKVISVSFM
jgi:hypothetical protein